MHLTSWGGRARLLLLMASLALLQALKGYEYYLHVERNLAPRTIREYLDDLTDLTEFLKRRLRVAEPEVQQVDISHLKDFLIHLQAERSFSSVGLARVISSVRGFFRYALEQELIPANPADALRTPKLPRRLPIYLDQSELRELFRCPDQSTIPGVRDHAILVTLANTGLRVSELAGLTLKSVNLQTDSIRVLGKGRKERLVPMNDAVKAVLQAWLAIRPKAPTDALFVGSRGEPFGARGIQLMMKKHGLRANIPSERLTPHKLRHTFATLLHMSEVDIIEIQALLGHANISSTQIYTHTNPRRLRSAVDRLSGLADES